MLLARLALVLGLVVVPPLIVGLALHNDPYQKSCTTPPALGPAGVPATPAPTGAAAAAKPSSGPTLRSGQKLELKFGRHPGARRRTFIFDNPSNARFKTQGSVIGDFVRDDDAPFRTDNGALRVDVAADSDNAVLIVSVCANRTLAGADPGSYTGTVALVGEPGSTPPTEPVNVPLVIKLADTNTRTLVPLYFVIVLLGGTVYSWALHRGLAADEFLPTRTQLDGYLHWWGTLAGLVSVAAGLAAAIGVFNAQYLSSDTWGSSGTQYLGLGAAMFGAFVGAGTLSRIPGGGKKDAPAGGAPPPAPGPP